MTHSIRSRITNGNVFAKQVEDEETKKKKHTHTHTHKTKNESASTKRNLVYREFLSIR